MYVRQVIPQCNHCASLHHILPTYLAQAATTVLFSVVFVAAKAELLNVNKVNIKAVNKVQIDKRRNKINSLFYNFFFTNDYLKYSNYFQYINVEKY